MWTQGRGFLMLCEKTQLYAGKPLEPEVLIMQKSEGLGNQQERLDSFSVGYLIGMIEAEGYICISKKSNKANTKGFRPVIGITNANLNILDRIQSVLKDFRVGHYISPVGSGNSLNCVSLTITGYKRCFRFLEVFKDLFTGKKRQANLMYEYCKYRLITYPTQSQARYTTRDDYYHSQMKTLNKSQYLSTGPKSSETNTLGKAINALKIESELIREDEKGNCEVNPPLDRFCLFCGIKLSKKQRVFCCKSHVAKHRMNENTSFGRKKAISNG